ncbi:MAG: lamin tail domain-containing protein [Saprospiraceae bacterium]
MLDLKKTLFVVAFFLTSLSYVSAQDTLEVMVYNLLNFPTVGIADREDTLRKIVQYQQPDILMVCELKTSGGADLILNNSLNVNGITKYQKANFVSNQSVPSNDLQGMLFYNSDKLTLYSQDELITEIRDINEYILYYNSPTLAQHNDTIFIDFYVAHLKSSDGSVEATKRWKQAKIFKDYIDAKPTDRNRIFAGDFNIYDSNEPSYKMLLDTGTYKMIDPINQPGNWSNNASFASIHTQSPRTMSFGSGASGGLDDRFDFMLISEHIDNALDSVSYIPNTYHALGNDGNHFNQNIIDNTNNSVPDSVLYAIYYMSDHLPVSMQLKIDVDLGTSSNNNIVFGQATDLIISEYVEGSSNNKYIELYNGTGASIDLSNYRIQRHTNGGFGGTSTENLSGILVNGSTYVIANNSANTTITNVADLTDGIINYNGDDVMELQKDNGSGTFVIIDVIGVNTGIDPGDGWDVAGTTDGTLNHTLVRKSTVCSPNDNWTTSAGTNATDSEWIVNTQDDFTDIGTHTQDCSVPTVNFDNTTSNGAETNAQVNILIPVTMQDYNNPVTLQVSVTGGTANPLDYDLNTTLLSFTTDGSQYISFSINPDGDNLDETVQLTITEQTSTGIIIIRGTHTITINDDECRVDNVIALPSLTCNGDDADFTVTWDESNTSGSIEVDINGNGYQTMTSGGTYTVQDANAATGVTVTARDVNDNTCSGTTTVDIPQCLTILPVAFINEFHYDDDGADDGEFVEIAIESSFSGNLSDFKITLYNGNNNQSYDTEYGDDLIVGSTVNGFTFYTWTQFPSGIQNGSSDGIALSYQGTLLEFISYEGTLTATNGDASGVTSVDVGVSESSSGITGISIQRTGVCSGVCPNGLTWTGPTTESPGTINTNQLPVELLYFTAKASNQMTILTWATASEENNAYFEVQHSINGINFETIGKVEGAGTTYDIQEYLFIDENPINGVNYYRLRQVDFDEQAENYEMVIVNINDLNTNITIAPIPVRNQFDVVFSETIDATIKMNIVSVNGQIVKSTTINMNGNRQTIDVSELNTGVYFIRMNVNNTIITKRFVKF